MLHPQLYQEDQAIEYLHHCTKTKQIKMTDVKVKRNVASDV